jgi:hypothetical protein
MSRLTFDLMPEEMPARSRRVLDAAFRSLRNVLDVAQGGVRMREQFRCVDTVIDTGELPVSITVEGIKSPPLSVLLLRATEQRSGSGLIVSGTGVIWEWRSGALLIHTVDGLGASTRYDVTLAVME